MGVTKSEQTELEKWIEIIWNKAHELGLDPYPTHFEVAPQHIIYELGAYGLPARFSHWTFGRDYHRQKTSYEYGLSKIYEIVFNTNPTQAFLVEDNSMLSHKFVIAHVLGHSDFFRRNSYFSHTNRQMIEEARLHAEQLREFETSHGWLEVERFLDAVLSIEMNFDPVSPIYREKSDEDRESDRKNASQPRSTDYDDLWNITGSPEPAPQKRRAFPEEPQRDLLKFLANYGKELEDWQRSIIEMTREEMLYFLPQMRTKIMNEGWASFWHERIMESLDLTSEEHWEFRRLHSSVLSPSASRMQINPYYVGFQILKDIERRWNGETEEEDVDETDWMGRKIERSKDHGLSKLFEVIDEDCDATFLRKYLTDPLVKKLDLYTYKRENIDGQPMWVAQDTDWRRVRDAMVDSMTNFGQPIITVEDGDYKHRGELYLKHAYDGKKLDLEWAKKTLENICMLWGRAVHLETVLNQSSVVLSCNEKNEFSQSAS
jgi:stage V sporulation protein R